MFWKRDKTVRVEIITPLTISSPISDPKAQNQVSDAGSQAKTIDTDLTFKFATFFALALQAALIIWGYLELAAYYEQFGIQTSELDLGTPTLLVYGYSYTFSELMSTVDRVPVLGAFIPAVVFVAIGAVATFLFFAMHGARKVGDIIQRSVWVGMALLLIFIAPTLAVGNAIDRANRNFEEYTGTKASYGLSKEHSIVTDHKETLTGHLIVADTKSTFILVNDTVYKVDNASNRVMRQTVLKPKPKKDSKTSPEAGG
ncbi:hypothetical protein QN400_12565 [Pseudomonas sp. RTC3]|uniref:hypothetical protein n=1 Tax=Pseudomonas sp. 5C2 TaxID=3048588 RepID=UPI002AB37E93|nr:hypothetical protein [Pseudomonas sp. 5C2]MDY7563485.1 hypothetical protein [Pseudomonas sp. 5C2]MEB0062866.1 hypothetical protein [Pseudomonas sp. RTC3]MEB0241135.1 hypothetical protein [Pseudomonas sp. 5C2]